MTINNPQSFVGQLWDWSVLDGCFGDTKIAPTDVDGLVEHNGHFLMLEAKNSGVSIPVGQAILHKAWLSYQHSLIVIYGEPGKPTRLECYLFGSTQARVSDPATIELLRSMVSYWFKKVHDFTTH